MSIFTVYNTHYRCMVWLGLVKVEAPNLGGCADLFAKKTTIQFSENNRQKF